MFGVILQEILFHFPKSLSKRKYFLLWSVDPKKGNVIPFCLTNVGKKLIIKKSMTGNLVTLRFLYKVERTKAFESIINQGLYGISLNLRASTNLVVIDLDSFDLDDFRSYNFSSSSNSNQNLVVKALSSVPCYWEISASGKGLHGFFCFPDFHKLINNRFIWKPVENVEIFVGGKVNKMIIVTGNSISIPSSEFETIVYRNNRRGHAKIVNATLSQLTPFITLLGELSGNKKSITSTTPTHVINSEPISLPSWLPKTFFVFKAKILPAFDPFGPKLEEQVGYATFLVKIRKLQEMTLKKDFSTYKSQSEIDYFVFALIVKLFKYQFTKEHLASILYTAIDFYQMNFPAREEKSSDYFLRTCHKSFVDFYLNSRSSSFRLDDIPEKPFCLVKTPLGLLAPPMAVSKQHLIVQNRHLLKDFDFDLYQILLQITVENYKSKKLPLTDMQNMKSFICCSVGDLARAVTSNQRISSFYYQRILSSLNRLANTRIFWNTNSSQGSLTLLDYIYLKDRKMVEVSFTNFVAWFLLFDTEIIKNSGLDYSVYYTNIFNLYKTPIDRKIYRFLINNVPIRTTRKVLSINEDLLSRFYPTYSRRRHSFYKRAFLKAIHQFLRVNQSDIRIEVLNDKLILNRINLSSTRLE